MKTIFRQLRLMPLVLLAIFQACDKREEIAIEPQLSNANNSSSYYSVDIFAGAPAQGDQDGTGTAARLTNVRHLAVCPSTDLLYLNDNGKVKSVSASGQVKTVSRQLPDASAAFNEEGGITVTANGSVYLAGWKSVFKLNSGGDFKTVATLVGNDRPFVNLGDLSSDPKGILYVADGSGLVRKISAADGHAMDFYNSGSLWRSICYAEDGFLYLVDIQDHVFKVSPSGEQTLIYPKQGQAGDSPLFLSDIAVAKDGTVYVSGDGKIHRISATGETSVVAMLDPEGKPFAGSDLVLANQDKTLFITDGTRIGKVKVN